MPRLKASILMLLFAFTSATFAQTDCPAIVQAALQAVDSACSATGRNQVCYGNIQLLATPREGSSAFAFEQTGDLANVGSIQSLQLSSMSLTDESWGVALMKLQANLPDTVPGQNVTFLLFGDVQIDNAAEDTPEITLKVTRNVNMRLRPTTSENNVIGGLTRGQEVTAIGQLADSTWVRIKIEQDPGSGWVSAAFLEGDFSSLNVVEPETSDAPKLGPMQAFYFRSGVADRPCPEAPDSGILVQTPNGAGRISFLANEVGIELGSTMYLQAGGGFMTVSVIEGTAILEAFNQRQLVPAGSLARVPLDVNGVAAGPPEFPQPYDWEALQALPVNVVMLEGVEVAPALTEAEIEAAIQAVQILGTSGTWSLTYTITASTCPDIFATKATYVLTFNSDGSITMIIGGAETILRHTGADTSTSTYTTSKSTSKLMISLTSPTTLSGQGIYAPTDGSCQATFNISGVWVAS